MLLTACGAPARPTPVATIAPVALDAAAPAPVGEDAAVKPYPALVVTMAWQVALPRGKSVLGPSFTPDGARVGVVVDGKLVLYDAKTHDSTVGPPGGAVPPDGPMLVIGAHAFVPSSGAEVLFGVGSCSEKSFSQDGSRISAYCPTGGKDAVVVYDAHTLRTIGTFTEFQSAAPVRTGSITASGNFIFWQARASGAFEEIKSHVTGPMISSHSVMSPDERFIFTAPDRNWQTDAEATGELIDPKHGRPLMAIPGDVESGTFSPSSRMLAVFRTKRTDAALVPLAVTLHATDHDGVLATLPTALVTSVAFSPDDTRLAAVTSAGALQLYTLETR